MDPNRFTVHRQNMFRIPTQAERPDLEFTDPLTPILGYGESHLLSIIWSRQERASMSSSKIEARPHLAAYYLQRTF